VTLDHPPFNIVDFRMREEFVRLADLVDADDELRVVVFQSANPDFFIAHADGKEYQEYWPLKSVPPKSAQLQDYMRVIDRFRTTPKVTIGKLDGIARGAGSELLLSLDMRFASLENARIGQIEAACGIIPGAATQTLAWTMGRSRALEVILGCYDFDGAMAERYGYVNRAMPAAELTPFVEAMAYRIATYPAKTIELAKRAVDAARPSFVAGLIEEHHLFNMSAALPEFGERMPQVIAEGIQEDRDIELNFDKLPDRMAKKYNW
jgi:enoyl-CoA hydratase/carnithine racemase